MPGPYEKWFNHSVNHCSTYLADVCKKFYPLACRYRIIDYYQKASPEETYSIVSNSLVIPLTPGLIRHNVPVLTQGLHEIECLLPTSILKGK